MLKKRMNTATGLMRKGITILYRLALPFVTIVLLLGISSIIARPRLFDKILFDLIVRIFLCIWFCGLYIRLSRFSEYSFYPNIRWSKADVSSQFEKFFYIGMGFLFGIGCAILTWWTIRTFLPLFSTFVNIISSINGLIILTPIMTQYWVIKL